MGQPHIIWVVADDLGSFDVPWTGTGSEIRTPHLSQLASSGLVLDSYYVQPLCTPTRAAFLTGRHPVQLGLQHGVIRDAVPDAVPAAEVMLPELLRAGGYATHAIGKWHLGFHQHRKFHRLIKHAEYGLRHTAHSP
jgi:arylsulfatase A-like enzyme